MTVIRKGGKYLEGNKNKGGDRRKRKENRRGRLKNKRRSDYMYVQLGVMSTP